MSTKQWYFHTPQTGVDQKWDRYRSYEENAKMPQAWDLWTVALTKNRPADRSLGGYFGATSLEDEKMKTKVGIGGMKHVQSARDQMCLEWSIPKLGRWTSEHPRRESISVPFWHVHQSTRGLVHSRMYDGSWSQSQQRLDCFILKKLKITRSCPHTWYDSKAWWCYVMLCDAMWC